MKAVEGGFLQLNLCYSICSGLGQEVNDRALGTYIWKQHVSKDFINPAVKGEKRRGKKWGRKGLIMGGWERTTKDHCRLFLTWRNNIFSCQGQTLIIIAKTCLPSSYESSRYWILLSGQDLGEDNRGIQYVLNVPHTPCLVFLVCNIPAYVYILFAVSFRLQLAGEGACATQMKEWAEGGSKNYAMLVTCVWLVCVHMCVCTYVCVSGLISPHLAGVFFEWSLYLLLLFTFLAVLGFELGTWCMLGTRPATAPSVFFVSYFCVTVPCLPTQPSQLPNSQNCFSVCRHVSSFPFSSASASGWEMSLGPGGECGSTVESKIRLEPVPHTPPPPPPGHIASQKEG